MIGTAIPKCFLCGEDKNLILMNMRLNNSAAKKVEDMHGKVIDDKPCDKCQEYMKQGIILIGVDEEKTTDPTNPYRTGAFAVVKDKVINDLVNPVELRYDIIKKRMCFVPDKVMQLLGII